MLKKTLLAFTFSLLVLLGNYAAASATATAAKAQLKQNTSESQPAGRPVLRSSSATEGGSLDQGGTGTLQKMIVESGNVTMDLDLNGLNGSSSLVARPVTLQFAVAADSFFPILIFNDQLRGPVPGSMALIPQNTSSAGFDAPGYSNLPAALGASLKQLVVEKLPTGEAFDLAVRDSNTGFTFFNVEGHQYDYDANAQALSITDGRLLVSKEFANALGRPSDAGSVVGKISVGAAMQPIEVTQLANGQPQSVVMPPMQREAGAEAPTLVAGPDIIVGDLPNMNQQGSAGTQVGLAVATTSCNNGDQPVDWLQLPNTDHPVIPQNFYRMSGGANNNDRFEQIGHSWMKHAFFALEDRDCFSCNTNGCETGSHLCPGCSDPYSADLNGGQEGIGSRAWVNPFTGSFPSNANDHSGHNHDGVSHRIRVEANDLNTTLNTGATYFAEAQYIAPSEYTWCQSHPGQCNMYNNASYRKYSVSGTTTFTFSPLLATVRMQPAIMAWTGATVNQVQPDPGNDGIWFMCYKVSGPSAGVWHYEYALYNQNLDRGIQSFTVPIGPGVNISNIGFHAPLQEPGWSNDGTFNNQGYSSAPWSNEYQPGDSSITWNCETFAQNQNANAIRFGTLYNFRFDADHPPNPTDATVGFFKTGSPIGVLIQAPGDVPAPSPTPTPTATATPTPTATATATPTPTATPRPTPIPRARPTPHPRP